MKDHPLVTLCKKMLRILFRISLRIEYRGLANIPKSGPALIVPNHQSYLDPLFVGAALPRPVRYMAMKKLFKWPVVSRFLKFYGAFPVTLRSPDKGSIKACIQFLKAGELVIIFPEGQRSIGGNLMDFYHGFARIALLQHVPIVAVTISGAYQVWPSSRRLPYPAKVRITFHPPLHPQDFPLGEESPVARIVQKVKDTIASAL
ncbi:MAG: 1-acyl-sn-glycerol-3-phosphate acyltransferase [Acidobacteria bacterium]|nr:1-acyl-sn-glycerol-3-phosphate acyltransferase [Acidobacteriota bacterium]